MRFHALAHCVTGDSPATRVLRRPGDSFDAEPGEVAALVDRGALRPLDAAPPLPTEQPDSPTDAAADDADAADDTEPTAEGAAQSLQ